MSKVLYIKANAKPEGMSRTFRISDRFVETYAGVHPDDEIITLDLCKERIDFLSADDINDIFGPKNEESCNHPILKYAYEFLSADKYVIAAPMWNLSIPAILKAYLDYITVSGITFQYTETGPVGLCQGKKAVYIVARGGGYSQPPMSDFEMGERYLRTLFAFFGITDFVTIAAESLDIIGQNVEQIVTNAIDQAQKAVKNF